MGLVALLKSNDKSLKEFGIYVGNLFGKDEEKLNLNLTKIASKEIKEYFKENYESLKQGKNPENFENELKKRLISGPYSKLNDNYDKIKSIYLDAFDNSYQETPDLFKLNLMRIINLNSEKKIGIFLKENNVEISKTIANFLEMLNLEIKKDIIEKNIKKENIDFDTFLDGFFHEYLMNFHQILNNSILKLKKEFEKYYKRENKDYINEVQYLIDYINSEVRNEFSKEDRRIDEIFEYLIRLLNEGKNREKINLLKLKPNELKSSMLYEINLYFSSSMLKEIKNQFRYDSNTQKELEKHYIKCIETIVNFVSYKYEIHYNRKKN